MKLTSHLSSWNCTNQRIFVRADLNVPLKNGKILDDTRLSVIQPTLDYILDQKGTVILATHLGRPKNQEASLSSKQLIPWFEKHSYSILFAATLEEAYTLSFNNAGRIILLENLRFFPEEKRADSNFAQRLSRCADRFVQDAFGTLHREDSTMILLPLQYASDERTIGFLVEKELEILNDVRTNPQHPFCLIMGGGKISDKIPVIESLLPHTDSIILCPAIVFSFLKAQNKPVGKSLVDDAALAQCINIIKKAGKKIIFPLDYQVAHNSIEGTLSITDSLEDNEIGISIGPKTVQLISSTIQQAQTIFFNGMIGFLDRKETLGGIQSIFTAMGKSNGMSIIAGGDSIAAAHTLGIKGISYYSTGGGATLTYLSGKKLPGLQPFLS